MSKENFKRRGHLQMVPRIELFSDAVFAIAITLLIIVCIEERHHSATYNEPLFESLFHDWQIFLSFVIGFVTIFVGWINHYMIFRYIKRINSSLLWFNGFVLMIITFIPFPTAIISEHRESETSETLLLCGVIYFLMACSYHLLWRCARKKGLLIRDTDDLTIRSVSFIYRFGVIYAAIALCISWISIDAGIILYILMFTIFGFPKKFADLIIKFKLVKPNEQK